MKQENAHDKYLAIVALLEKAIMNPETDPNLKNFLALILNHAYLNDERLTERSAPSQKVAMDVVSNTPFPNHPVYDKYVLTQIPKEKWLNYKLCENNLLAYGYTKNQIFNLYTSHKPFDVNYLIEQFPIFKEQNVPPHIIQLFITSKKASNETGNPIFDIGVYLKSKGMTDDQIKELNFSGLRKQIEHLKDLRQLSTRKFSVASIAVNQLYQNLLSAQSAFEMLESNKGKQMFKSMLGKNHTEHFEKLIEEITNIMNSTLPDEKKLQAMIVKVEEQYQYKVNFSNEGQKSVSKFSLSKFGSRPKSNSLEDKLNVEPEKHHYLRLLGLVLKDTYAFSDEHNLPTSHAHPGVQKIDHPKHAAYDLLPRLVTATSTQSHIHSFGSD